MMETDISHLNIRLVRQLPIFLATYGLQSISVWLKIPVVDQARSYSFEHVGDYHVSDGVDRARSPYYIFHYSGLGLAKLYHDPSLPQMGSAKLESMKNVLGELLYKAAE
jgi:hypothetical protein